MKAIFSFSWQIRCKILAVITSMTCGCLWHVWRPQYYLFSITIDYLSKLEWVVAVKNKLSSAIVYFVKAFHHFDVCPTINICYVKATRKNPLSRSFVTYNSIFDGKGRARRQWKGNLFFIRHYITYTFSLFPVFSPPLVKIRWHSLVIFLENLHCLI